MNKDYEQLDELSTDKLAQYKKKAGEDASDADARGDYKRGNKRFAGIIKATKKQFKNDLKETQLDKDGYPIIQAGSEDVPVKRKKGPKMTQESTPQIRAIRSIIEAKKVAATQQTPKDDSPPKFKSVSCSQCGQKFGPGNSGFSSCKEHRKAKIFAIPEEVQLQETFDDAEAHKVAAEKAKAKGNMGAYHAHMADHHEAMAEWNASKGRHSVADKHAEKAEEHHEASLKHPYVKEEFELDEVSTAQMSHQGKTTIKHIKDPGVELRMAAHDIKPGIAGYRDRIALLRAAKAQGKLKEALDEAIQVGHKVHVGHKVKGGAGVTGEVTKIDGDKVYVKNSEGKTFRGQLGNASKMNEEIVEDLSTRFTESVQRYIAGQIDNIALNSIAIQLAEAVAKDQDISFERAYNIAIAYIEEMLKESNSKFQDRMQSYVEAVNTNAKYDSEKFEEAYNRNYRGELGLASKRSFKRNELEHELRHEVEPRRPSYTPRPSTPQAKIYHKVPYAQKEDAKKEGMRWDPDQKKWYHSDHAKSSASKFQKEEVELDETKSTRPIDWLQHIRKREREAELKAFRERQKQKSKTSKKVSEEVELDEASKGDKEHTALQKFMAARRLKQAEKSGTKKSQDWHNKQASKKNLPEEVELDEAGAFSYGAKPPRKGTVTYYAMMKQKEQEKKKSPIEPKDQMVGTAKVLSKEEFELDEAIPYALSAANYNASPSSSKYKGEVKVPLKHVGGTADYKAIKKHVASKGLKVDSIGTGDDYKTVTLASNQHTADELKRKLGINEETSLMDLYLEALQSTPSILK